MRRVNIAAPPFAYEQSDPDGFQTGMARLGPALGAEQTGASVYELAPGQSVCPYHYEYGEEEWLLVLRGSPSLRDPQGTERLEPWDLVFFPRGPEGTHEIRNDTDKTVRVLMWSTVVLPTATVYPDSDKIGVWTGNPEDDVMVQRTSRVDYWHGEER